jgi:transcription termination factor NusB
MPKSYSKQVDDFMEGTEYGTLSPTIDVFSEEDFRYALKEYDEAQRFRELALNADFQLLLHKLSQNAQEQAKRQYDYRGVDPIEKEKRNQNQRQAAFALEFVQGIINNAEETPRPRLVKQ